MLKNYKGLTPLLIPSCLTQEGFSVPVRFFLYLEQFLHLEQFYSQQHFCSYFVLCPKCPLSLLSAEVSSIQSLCNVASVHTSLWGIRHLVTSARCYVHRSRFISPGIVHQVLKGAHKSPGVIKKKKDAAFLSVWHCFLIIYLHSLKNSYSNQY